MNRAPSLRRLIGPVAAAGLLALTASGATAAPHDPGGTIVFASYASGASTSDLWSMDPSGGHRRQLTDTPNDSEQQPAISPDGHRVVYRFGDLDHPSTFELKLLDLRTGAVTQITHDNWTAESPSWTPDGREILFASNVGDSNPDCQIEPGCDLDIYTVRPDGTHLQRLTDIKVGAALYPSVSPDGRSLAVTVLNGDGDAAIFTMGIHGSHIHQLTAFAERLYLARWSPNGTQFAYLDNACLTCGASDVWTMRVDGTDRHRIHRSKDFGDFAVNWSPDGEWISFDELGAVRGQIYRVKPTGGPAVRIATPGDDFEASWGR